MQPKVWKLNLLRYFSFLSWNEAGFSVFLNHFFNGNLEPKSELLSLKKSEERHCDVEQYQRKKYVSACLENISPLDSQCKLYQPVRIIASILVKELYLLFCKNVKDWGSILYFLKGNWGATWNCYYMPENDNSISSNGLKCKNLVFKE